MYRSLAFAKHSLKRQKNYFKIVSKTNLEIVVKLPRGKLVCFVATRHFNPILKFEVNGRELTQDNYLFRAGTIKLFFT